MMTSSQGRHVATPAGWLGSFGMMLACCSAALPALAAASASDPLLVQRPIANAGNAVAAQPFAKVTLSGSSSTSTAGPLSYLWRQLSGPMVALNGLNTASPQFVVPNAPVGTTLKFSLSVTAQGLSSTSEVAVKIVPDNPWGVAPSTSDTRGPALWTSDMAAAGVAGVRNFDSTTTDDRLKPLADAGMAVTGILQWSSVTPARFPVNDLNGWRNYVMNIVMRYKGRIRHWEVWNEPPNFSADKSPMSYAAIVSAAYDAAKAVDPDVQIGLAAKSNHVNWLAQSIEAGAADKFDFVALHPYENAGLLPQGWEGQFMSIVPRVRTMLLDKNPAKAEVPVWFTEVGVQVATGAAIGVSPQAQADALAKIYTLSLAQGAARVYWFSPRDSEGLYMGLTTSNRVRRPAYTAMRVMSSTLGAQPNYLGWLQPGGAYYGFAFAGPSGTVLAAWARPGQSNVIALTAPVTVIDPRTGASSVSSTVTLTDAPVLLSAPASSAQALQWQREAAANAGKAFPWGGTQRDSTASVSLVAGSAPQGVFMLNAPVPSYAGGVAEFNLAGRWGARFTVDPAFLSYTATPIRMSIVLRAHGTGDPGFNLKYESNVPLSRTDSNGLVAASSGWHRVSSTNFYERSWVINNPRFVGLYGYNFFLDTDGPAHSQFSIQKVSVTKL